MKYGTKWPEYARQWDAMIINSSREEGFRKLALKFIDLKPRYVPLANQTGIPWQIFAVMHMRESNNDFSKSLAQGDPWNRQSTNEPISGPFSSFEESAIWTMNHDGLTNVIDWRLEKQLWHLERLNGLGYALGPTDNRTGTEYPPMPSPYIWGGTNQQRPGKYIRDHVFDPNTMDTQPGCAAILWMLAKLDPTIEFVRETPMGVEPPTTGNPPMADTDLAELLAIIKKMETRQTLMQMEIAAVRAIAAGETPEDPPEVPPKTEPKPPVVVAPPIEPLDLKTLIISAIGAIVAPATGVSEAVDKGTLGSLIPYVGMAASAFGIPSWILPLAGRLLGRMLPTGVPK